MENNKIKINIEFDIETLNTVHKFVNWANLDEKFEKVRRSEYTIEDFIRGAVSREIERQKIHDEIFCEIKTKGLRKPKSKIRNNFKGIMKQLGIKQLELSELTGITESELSLALNNKRPLSFEYFMLIWTSLGCPAIEKCFYLEE